MEYITSTYLPIQKDQDELIRDILKKQSRAERMKIRNNLENNEASQFFQKFRRSVAINVKEIID